MNLEHWNYANVVVLIAGIILCLAYARTHTNGKARLALWVAFVMLMGAIIRLTGAQTNWLRPWAVLSNMLAPLLLWSDWKKNRR